MGGTQSNRAEVQGYKDTYAEFEKELFKEGTSRRVYRGTFRGDPRVEGKQCVVKVNKEPYSLEQSEYAWEADKRAYEKSHEMAQLFNAKYETTKPVEFVQPEFTIVDPHAASNFLGFDPYGPGGNIPKQVTVVVERYLDGSYEKFSDNRGYVHPKEMATPAAFSHFTYDVTNGEILVCDLQGVRTNTSYKFTDPAVNNGGNKPHMYGTSDIGKLGIVKFFESHKCNTLCEGLKKPRPARDCTTGEVVEFNDVLSKMPGDCSNTLHTYQLDIPKSQFDKIQINFKLEAV